MLLEAAAGDALLRLAGTALFVLEGQKEWQLWQYAAWITVLLAGVCVTRHTSLEAFVYKQKDRTAKIVRCFSSARKVHSTCPGHDFQIVASFFRNGQFV